MFIGIIALVLEPRQGGSARTGAREGERSANFAGSVTRSKTATAIKTAFVNDVFLARM